MATLEAKRGGRTKAITPVGLFNYSNHFKPTFLLLRSLTNRVKENSSSSVPSLVLRLETPPPRGGRRSPGGGRVAVGREGFS